MKKSASTSCLSNLPIGSTLSQSKRMKRNVSVEAAMNTLVDLEYMATKFTVSQVASCVMATKNFPTNILNHDDIEEISTCIVTPQDVSESEHITYDIHRYLKILRNRSGFPVKNCTNGKQ